MTFSSDRLPCEGYLTFFLGSPHSSLQPVRDGRTNISFNTNSASMDRLHITRSNGESSNVQIKMHTWKILTQNSLAFIAWVIASIIQKLPT